VRVYFDRLNYILLWVAGCFLLFTVLAVCIEVCMRYFLGRPTLWSLEVTGHMLVWITFLGTAWVLESEGHVIIDFFIQRARPRTQAITNGATSILCALACLCVAWYGGQVVVEQFRSGLLFPTALALPMWPLFLIIPLSFFLLFLQFMRRALRYYQRKDRSP
jgi:TRAP-type C4-dicarboxylate transport system permease small subunit